MAVGGEKGGGTAESSAATITQNDNGCSECIFGLMYIDKMMACSAQFNVILSVERNAFWHFEKRNIANVKHQSGHKKFAQFRFS
jgi:hypothetical protein